MPRASAQDSVATFVARLSSTLQTLAVWLSCQTLFLPFLRPKTFCSRGWLFSRLDTPFSRLRSGSGDPDGGLKRFHQKRAGSGPDVEFGRLAGPGMIPLAA